MPLRREEIALKRLHTYSAVLIAFLITASVFMGPEKVLAQKSLLRLPYIAPSRPSLYHGLFSINSGVKWRTLNTVKMVVLADVEPGVAGVWFQEERYPFTGKVWTPIIECSYQEQNFFDLFTRFSYFTVHNDYVLGQLSRGNNAGRQKFTSFNMNMDVYELHAGGRSWFPLWGFGRIATSLGATTSVVPFEVEAIKWYLGGGLNRATWQGHFEDYFFHLAVIGGAELEVDYRNVYLKGGVEYSYGTQYFYEDTAGAGVMMNPAGFGWTLVAGLRF